jgi:dTDP-4-amino-4,6-dideoxygalactose transaminase
VPVHLQPAYADLGYPAGSLPVTEAISREVVSLPMYPELGDKEIQTITNTVQMFIESK